MEAVGVGGDAGAAQALRARNPKAMIVMERMGVIGKRSEEIGSESFEGTRTFSQAEMKVAVSWIL